jgi:TPR repeat protein
MKSTQLAALTAAAGALSLCAWAVAQTPGPGQALHAQGSAAYERGDFAAALRSFILAAEQGNADAQNTLGNMYATGSGVSENFVEAVRLYRLAAEQGNPEAQTNMGYMLQEGLGVPQNPLEAVRWYRLAAERGYADAQTSMGFMHQEGLGVPQSDVEALRWYRLAAEQGNAVGQRKMGWAYENGLAVPERDVRQQVEAVRWYHLAAEQGDSPAQYSLALIYDRYAGEGLQLNKVEAWKWYVLAEGGAVPEGGFFKELEAVMTPAELAEARRLVAEWKPRS